jgi:glycine betaine/proline transport system ATP-binding protein
VVSASAGPRAALRTMRDLQTSTVFVVAAGRRLLGAVHDRDVLRLVQRGERSLEPAIRDDYTTVGPDQYLTDLLEGAALNPLPLAVLDDQGRLLGAVPRVTLLAALGNLSTDTAEIQVIEPPATIPVHVITETLRATSEPEAPAPEGAAPITGEASNEGGAR